MKSECMTKLFYVFWIVVFGVGVYVVLLRCERKKEKKCDKRLQNIVDVLQVRTVKNLII